MLTAAVVVLDAQACKLRHPPISTQEMFDRLVVGLGNFEMSLAPTGPEGPWLGGLELAGMQLGRLR